MDIENYKDEDYIKEIIQSYWIVESVIWDKEFMKDIDLDTHILKCDFEELGEYFEKKFGDDKMTKYFLNYG